MQHDVAQNLPRVLMIVGELRTAVVMMPRMQLHFGSGQLAGSHLLLYDAHDAFSNTVHATNRRYHPYLVADADFTVAALIATERAVLASYLQLFVNGFVSIGERTLQIGLQVMLVHPLSGLQVFASMADGVAVFNDVGALGGVADKHFVTSGRVL